MRLSNTMIMNEALLPSTKKAFTLAEVLITLSILGVVAALTIPSLVNRQNELAAITKMKKAISTYESVVEVYMAENEATNFAAAAAGGCSSLKGYFKMTDDNGAGSGCVFTTADGVVWEINSNGYAVIVDSAKSPRYGVAMWAEGGVVNGEQTEGINGDTRPKASFAPQFTGMGSTDAPSAPNHGYYKAAAMLNISGSQNQETNANRPVSSAFPVANP